MMNSTGLHHPVTLLLPEAARFRSEYGRDYLPIYFLPVSVAGELLAFPSVVVALGTFPA